MPIEGEFAEPDFGWIREGCKRMGKEFMVWIVTATDSVNKTIERRATQQQNSIK
jgi:hypothetical protein